MNRYAHTNIIAENSEKLISFYEEIFGCRRTGETRDLKGQWVDELTGLKDAHIVGEHLVMPGYGADHPTLEIFSYDHMEGALSHRINTRGLAHLAFEVEDVEETMKRILDRGGRMVGELVHAEYEDGRKAVFVYVTDVEGNIIELQSWEEMS